MVRRKPISVTGRFNNRLFNPFPDMVGDTYSYQTLLNKIEDIRNAAHQKALSKYNSDMFKNPIIEVPDAVYVSNPQIHKTVRVVNRPIKSSLVPVKSYTNKQQDFTNDMYDAYYKAVRPGAQSDADADRQARFLTQKAALETGYGTSTANTHNYGGHKTKNGWLSFKSMDDFAERDVKLLDKKWSGWRNAKDGSAFIDSINTNNGYGQYAPPNENTDYKGKYLGTTNRVNRYINMRKRSLRYGGSVERPKAWIGAAIGAATSLLGSVLNANAQERQQREQRRLQEHKAAIERAQGLTESLGLMQAAQKEYEDRFRIAYSCGGRRRLRDGIRITDGGYGIPIGRNTFLLQGGKHEDINETGQTGIGMKVGGKVVEAEDNEVVQKTPKEVRIFSDSLILPNGMTPAEYVLNGGNKDYAFNIQQDMNGDYGINSKRRLRNGGSVSRPVERIVYEPGGALSLKLDPYDTRAAKIARNKAKRDLGRKQLSSSNYLTKIRGLYNLYQGTPWLGGELEVNGQVYTGVAPSFGMRSAPNVTKIVQNANKTKQAFNAVKQSMAKAKNNIKVDKTKNPKIINESKTVKQVAQEDAKRYKWTHSKPTENKPYEGAKAGIYEGNFFEPNVGNLKFASTGDRIRGTMANVKNSMSNIDGRVAAAKAFMAGSSIPVGILAYNTLIDKNNNNTTNVVNNGINVSSNKFDSDIKNDGTLNEVIVTSNKQQKPTSDTKKITDATANNTNFYNNRKFSNNFTKKISLGDNTVTIPDINTGLAIARLPSKNDVRHLSDGNNIVSSNNTTNVVNNDTLTTGPNTVIGYTPEQELEYINNNIKNNYQNADYNPDDERKYIEEEIRLRGVNPSINNNGNISEDEYFDRMQKYAPRNGQGYEGAIDNTNTNTVEVNNRKNWLGANFKGADWIGLGADLIGGIGSALINYNAASNIQDPVPPVRVSPGKLITNYNIAPRLAEASMMRSRMLRDSDEGVSSAARLNRRNDIYTYTNNYMDRLYGEKTNKEIELLNTDTLNQQQFNTQNVEAYNEYLKQLQDARMRRGLAKANAWQAGLSGIGDAVGNLLDQGKQRYSDQQAMRYYAALLPEEGLRHLRRSGVDFLRRGGKIY